MQDYYLVSNGVAGALPVPANRQTVLYNLYIIMIDWITEDHIDIMMSWYNEKDVFWPSLRFILELVVIWYDESMHSTLCSFLDSLSWLIPCEECAKHFREQLMNNNIPKNRIDILKLLIDMHNNVNRWNWKPELTFRDALKSISERIELKRKD